MPKPALPHCFIQCSPWNLIQVTFATLAVWAPCLCTGSGARTFPLLMPAPIPLLCDFTLLLLSFSICTPTPIIMRPKCFLMNSTLEVWLLLFSTGNSSYGQLGWLQHRIIWGSFTNIQYRVCLYFPIGFFLFCFYRIWKFHWHFCLNDGYLDLINFNKKQRLFMLNRARCFNSGLGEGAVPTHHENAANYHLHTFQTGIALTYPYLSPLWAILICISCHISSKYLNITQNLSSHFLFYTLHNTVMFWSSSTQLDR